YKLMPVPTNLIVNYPTSYVDEKKYFTEMTKLIEQYNEQEDILKKIEEHREELALVMIGGVNYYTGQLFDIEAITKAGHTAGAKVGFDLAHAAGNINLKLNEWGPDFAVWCSYKYLNSGPGSVGGCFVHERHAKNKELKRFTGWWGHNKQTRFNMRHEFDPIPGAEGWQLSNPPILSLAAIRASLAIFDEAGFENIRAKSVKITNYLEYLLKEIEGDQIEIITPQNPEERGCQLSIKVKNANKALFDKLMAAGVISDWREPNVIRVAPAPLYNSFEDVYKMVERLKALL
ncbi:kynureninase, partial [Mesonia mobilis]|uniref:kynureninase n=1 Tax=Mesonia mobilis TaxID=369791 RepID=UPI0026EBC89A